MDLPAASSILVVPLPEGHYTLETEVAAINPGGGSSVTQLRPVEVDVGCRQTIQVDPDIQVAVDGVPSCVSGDTVRVTGHVTSILDVASVTWSSNGGPWNDACRPCGPDPTFAFDAPIVHGDNRIEVRADDSASFSSSVSFTAHAALEPSARDLDPTVEPLRVSRDGRRSLHLSWQDLPPDPYAVHQGTIASLWVDRRYDHAPVDPTCGVTIPEADVDFPTGNVYFLVTCDCGAGPGSFGRNSFHAERPPALASCP
jgi:hypothetical protein